MSKMSELDLIAQGVADHVKEIIEDTVDWQLADQPLDGDDYQDMKEYMKIAGPSVISFIVEFATFDIQIFLMGIVGVISQASMVIFMNISI